MSCPKIVTWNILIKIYIEMGPAFKHFVLKYSVVLGICRTIVKFKSVVTKIAHTFCLIYIVLTSISRKSHQQRYTYFWPIYQVISINDSIVWPKRKIFIQKKLVLKHLKIKSKYWNLWNLQLKSTYNYFNDIFTAGIICVFFSVA